MELKGKRIAFLGDSITEGVGATNFHGYVDCFSELTGAYCENFGISGTRIAKQKKPTVDSPSFDYDFCMRADKIKGNFDVIVVFGGTNDFGHGDADFGAFSDRTPDTFYGALHTLYQTLMQKHPDSKIVVITPIYRTDEEEISAVKKQKLRSYVGAIREVAEYYNLPVLNLFESQKPPYKSIINDSLLADGVHPNDEGHKFIAEKIKVFLENNL